MTQPNPMMEPQESFQPTTPGPKPDAPRPVSGREYLLQGDPNKRIRVDAQGPDGGILVQVTSSYCLGYKCGDYFTVNWEDFVLKGGVTEIQPTPAKEVEE